MYIAASSKDYPVRSKVRRCMFSQMSVYLRLTDESGNVSYKLVLGKFRVVPRKKQTVPRYELTAAQIGAKLVACVQHELDLPLDTTVMWTLHTIVLGYITNCRKRFQMFVANRVAAILS